MSEEISRVCPYCAEQVNAAAKICPQCRQWLSVFSLRNPVVFLLIFYFGMSACVVSFLIFLHRIYDPGINFSPYRDSISIVESRMNLQADGKQPMVIVVGLLTNKSDVAWKDIQIDARFFDKTGTMIDARVDWGRGVIFPHDEMTFRIRSQPSHPLLDYDSYKIFVRSARDARAHF